MHDELTENMQEGHDYMSDTFLKELEDVRPGLLNREAKRKARVQVRELPKSKKIKVIENEAREKGLSMPISSDNKGFALLQKMGYKEGTSLGKSGEGKTSLIPLVIKDGKTGLGRKKFLTEKRSEAKDVEARNFSDFRLRKQASLAQQKCRSNLRKSRLACQQLDTASGITAPLQDWFWPEELLPKPEEETESDSDSDEQKEEEAEEEEEQPSQQLEKITAYLRATHFYCVWCGTAYEGEEDMEANCPGDTEEAHD